MAQHKWIDMVDTDLNRPARNGAYFCRTFAYEDGTGSPAVGDIVFISAGGDAVEDACPGLLGRVIKVYEDVKELTPADPEQKWRDHYRYVDVEAVDWEVVSP